MILVKTYIHGIYPRSNDLIQTSREMIRKKKKESDYLSRLKKDISNLQQIQKANNFDYLEDGKLNWHDIFRPIVESTSGFKIGALTRWFDNNCFFRQPVAVDKLKLDKNSLDKLFPKITPEKKWKVTLPSPYTFARLTLNETGSSFENLLDQITGIISEIISYLDKKGVSFVQLNEPFLPYQGPGNQDIVLFNKMIKKLESKKGSLKIALHLYFGDAGPVLKKLDKNKFIDIIGIDFYKTALSSLPKKFDYALAAGIVDGRNSLLEDPKTLNKFINDAADLLKLREIYITNNSDLDLLPETIASKKIEILAGVKNLYNK